MTIKPEELADWQREISADAMAVGAMIERVAVIEYIDELANEASTESELWAVLKELRAAIMVGVHAEVGND